MLRCFSVGLRTMLCLAALTMTFANARAANEDVKKVFVVFKTHLDIGFTDLSSNVEKRYAEEFIPKAVEVSRILRECGGEERYVWTTGSWLVDAYLKQADAESLKAFETAVENGDIVWNGVPYTVESESMNRDLFEQSLYLSKKLDERFGKKTVSAKMTDVPGHTRGIVPVLADAGIKLLHIGSNPAASVPEIPSICLWRDVSGKEIVLIYQKGYGEDIILPDGETALSINFTGDNHGPHTVGQVREIFRRLREHYPNADIEASSLNSVAEILEAEKSMLPILESEIGDTWIYGYGSSPLRIAKFRALGRLFSRWLGKGIIAPYSQTAVDFAVRLGMIAEHTWGADIKSFLGNWDKYDFDAFTAARSLPEFRFVEDSWRELDNNIGKALEILPERCRKEAEKEIARIESPAEIIVPGNDSGMVEAIDDKGRYDYVSGNLECLVGGVSYQTFSADDFDRFQEAYLTDRVWWALADYGKPGLENSNAKSATLEAEAVSAGVKHGRLGVGLVFPDDERVDSRVLPESVRIEYSPSRGGRALDVRVSLLGKPANRLPEAYWFSFQPENLVGIIAEKTGSRINLLDVVAGGNRQMHGIDGYVDLITDDGILRITSLDAPLLVVGERNLLNYSTSLPDLSRGVHFCLYNNLWGTNFSMWWEGSLTFRFRIECL
ncbi:MAG: DUF5054 domain-containing protein [Candidatus Cryptobacteroides sp.]